jgi:hypothetical protein
VKETEIPFRSARGDQVFERTLSSPPLPHSGEAGPHSSRESRRR